MLNHYLPSAQGFRLSFPKSLYLAFVLCLSVILLNPAWASTQQSPLAVKYVRVENMSPFYAEQSRYFFELFKLAMSKSESNFDIQVVSLPSAIPQGRSILLLQQGHYDVHWMTTNPEREALLQPIRIPLFKGLIGFRLMFVHQDTPNLFSHISDAQQLKHFLGGQGRDWPDTKLMREQGFKVQEATTTRGLLEMLSRKRVEYVPRSILEIWNEKQASKNLPIIVDQHIALQYPSAVYFFVTKENQMLHTALEKGLNTAIKDGSFEALFKRFIGADLARSKLSNRKIIKINNPNMSKETPLDNPKYWFSTK